MNASSSHTQSFKPAMFPRVPVASPGANAHQGTRIVAPPAPKAQPAQASQTAPKYVPIPAAKPAASTAHGTAGIRSESKAMSTESDAQITKSGTPDRRFKANRGQPAIRDEKTPRTEAAIFNGIHVTTTGKPDARYMENRGKDQATLLREWAQNVLAKEEEAAKTRS